MARSSDPVASHENLGRPWMMLGAIAACCAGPMVLIVVLVSVLGLAIGPAAAIALGLVAAGLCVAVMTVRHRRRR
jgi:hypothetical protein